MSGGTTAAPHRAPTSAGSVLEEAHATAVRYAEQSGVVVRLLETPGEMAAAAALLADVWGMEAKHSRLDPSMLVAMVHSGNYVTGAFIDGVVVAASVGFFHPPLANAMHSHITGVLRAHSGHGIGAALKFHQRAWCLERSVATMTWTFDPLVARNAYFNLRKLGGRAVEYLPDFYGPMLDELNLGQPSDRMLLEWDLRSPIVRPAPLEPPAVALLLRGPDGPIVGAAPADGIEAIRIDLPEDIEALRVRDASAARAWRDALRTVTIGLLADGWQLTDFDRRGFYRAERTTHAHR